MNTKRIITHEVNPVSEDDVVAAIQAALESLGLSSEVELEEDDHYDHSVVLAKTPHRVMLYYTQHGVALRQCRTVKVRRAIGGEVHTTIDAFEVLHEHFMYDHDTGMEDRDLGPFRGRPVVVIGYIAEAAGALAAEIGRRNAWDAASAALNKCSENMTVSRPSETTETGTMETIEGIQQAHRVHETHKCHDCGDRHDGECPTCADKSFAEYEGEGE